jgi:hypothetical protein
MNREHIQHAIELMKAAEAAGTLDMNIWQDDEDDTVYDLIGKDYAETVEELHACGNTACLAGHIALSPVFQAIGGKVDQRDGSPIVETVDKDGDTVHKAKERAVALFFGIRVELAHKLCLPPFLTGVDPFYPVEFEDVQPHHVIDELQNILDEQRFSHG